jgi:hypothetical protein
MAALLEFDKDFLEISTGVMILAKQQQYFGLN